MVSGPTAASDSDDHISRLDSPPTFFIKDRRKIHVGDCALFRADHVPPFIGVIRWFTKSNDNKLKLGVNWLYRPSDIKLGKGILVDAAPNEVFYSFNWEEIPAASLLHPCKVAFLCKDIELPSGLSSFVCRRVYDNEKKRLWWLTDQDFINGHQEEVNQLLDRTRLEMHALHTGGRSPKTLNGSVSSQQLKSGSDDGQTSGTSVTAPVKRKKRERCDQDVGGSIKRERCSKIDDVCSGEVDSLIKAEIAKITRKGELVSTEGVDRLVHLMRCDRSEGKLDLAGKVVVADLIAGTKRFDCLNRFVQIRGVLILDDWLQEAHKGKTGNGSSPKGDDKSTEELLLALLRALDKLPVNLNALQACNIGKSVNHLRAYKNQEIQKKARSLVDTWKKRVDAEMDKINDVTSVSSASWASRPGFPDASCGAKGHAGSADAVIRNTNIQPSISKVAVSSKPGNSDIVTKVQQVTPGSTKASVLSSSVSRKDSDKIRGCEHLMVEAKEEKISYSCQSQNSSQSCSSSHAKTSNSLLKDDAKSSFAGSTNTSKTTSGSSRHRRSRNDETGISGEADIEMPTTRSKMMATDTASQPVSARRRHDVPITDLKNSHRLIVRIPNHGRCPIRSASGGSFEDPSLLGVKASSSKDHDCKIKLRNEVSRGADVNTELWQSSAVKQRLASSNKIERSRGSVFNDECCKSPDEAGKGMDSSKTACSSSANEKEIILAESSSRNSLSSKNVLLESCASYSEARASLAVGDDVGMNLLASVAAGEMSRSSLASPGESTVNSADANKPHQGGASEKVRYSPDSTVVQSESKRNSKEEDLAGEVSELQPISATTFQNQAPSVKFNGKNKEEEAKRSIPSSTLGENTQEFIEVDEISQRRGRVNAKEVKGDPFCDCEHQVTGQSLEDKKGVFSVADKSEESDASNGHNAASARKLEKVAKEEISSRFSNIDAKKETVTDNEPNACSIIDNDGCPRSSAENSMHVEKANNREGPNNPEIPSHLETSDKKKINSVGHSIADDQGICTSSTGVEEVSETKDDTQSIGELKKCVNSSIPMSSAMEEKKSNPSFVDCEVYPAIPDVSKVDFDLNEGFITDDGSPHEPVILGATTRSPTSHFDVAFRMSNILQAPLTVAVPAKGPFVPPECLLKNKVEAGWKGSAVTSAFRPAESRKGLEMQLDALDASSPYTISRKRDWPVLDIDLNVPDDSALDDLASQNSAQTVGSESGAISNYKVSRRSSGALDLDLNKVDERTDDGKFMASFDLNGPGLDVVVPEPSVRYPHAKSSNMSLLPSFPGIRINNSDMGNMSAWFSPGSLYSAIPFTSLPDRVEQPYSVMPTIGAERLFGPVNGGSTFGGDVHRSSTISSPLVAFSHATALPYAGFPLGSTFPLSSTMAGSFSGTGPCLSNMPSQLVGSTGAVSSPFVRPFVISLQEGGASVGPEGGQKLGRHGLDLNAGPGF